LLRRGADRVRGYLGAEEPADRVRGYPGAEVPAGPHGIDVAGVTRAAGRLADRIERDGLDGLTPADLRPRLAAL
jgi:hypothetical protein